MTDVTVDFASVFSLRDLRKLGVQMNSIRIIASLIVVAFAISAADAAELTREQLTFFEAKIRPVLIRECYGCHSNKSGNVRGGLRLDTKQLMLIGGSSGAAIVPGKPDESWLYNAITHQDFVMPPKRKLPQTVINDFRKWIEMGAPDPRVNAITKVNSKITKEDIQRAKSSFWAYQPPAKKKPNATADRKWSQTEIDRFILAKLEQAELKPAKDAQARSVLRRLTFDLVGLPPTLAEIEAFNLSWKRDETKAISDVVDRLLKSKQYGERWGRHWLDVARFAESTGREVNMTYPQAWRYRDYVIDAFNDDKPFGRFVQEQIAGDLLPVKTDEQWARNLVATTFLAIGAKNVNEQNAVQFAANVVDEQIDATTRVFMGMSVACARCHDHKFDAIPQADYYAMVGIFQNMKTFYGNPQSSYGSFSGAQAKRNSTLLILPIDDPNPFDESYTSQELEQLHEDIKTKRREASANRRNQAGGGAGNAQRQRAVMQNALAKLSGRIASVDDKGKPYSFSMGVQNSKSPTDAKVLVRGEIDQPAQTVKRGFPQVLTGRAVGISSKSSGRLELARWIGSKDNPLTARVMVNRIWLHMIGRGIVTSTENFGTTGQMPSHPELLDYLAVRFVESGWSVKTVIHEIATSRVYRIQSTYDRHNHDYDPDNGLVWRANPRRLDAEAIRDAMLRISGEIDFKRPRASEVAKAGFVRVQDGRLSSPGRSREQGANQQRQPQAGGGQFRPGAQGGGQARPGQRRPGGRPGRRPGQGGFAGRPAGRVNNPLDMETAKFRSVYLPIVRDAEPRSLDVFDYADSSAIIGRREESHTANQALYMMNNPFVIQQSEAFAKRLSEMSTRSDEQIEFAFVLAYGRLPTSGERAATSTFIRRFAPTTTFRNRNQATLAVLCQSLFASAEFRYID